MPDNEGPPIRACLEVNANNTGFDLAGNYQPDATINVPSWCTYDNPNDEDEETRGKRLGLNFVTHEMARIRGLQNNDSDWHKNRVKERNKINDEETSKALLIAGAIALATGVL